MDDCTWIYRDQLGVDPLQEDYLRKGVDHGVYVDDMKHVPTSDSIMQAREFLAEYSSESVSPRDCKTILGTEKLMDSFCCLQYEQSHRGITSHRDAYIQELLRDYVAQATERIQDGYVQAASYAT